MNTSQHATYLSLALELASKGRGTVSPNPMVGCIIVKNNEIIGRGYHQFAGGPHAEVIALQQAGCDAHDATVYVTLEPCCHYGRTPPCTQALIAAGVREVYVCCLDPNEKVSGKGIAALESAGIPVVVGLLKQEAFALNEIFFHYMSHKKPFVIAKWAMSLDGKTTVNQADDKAISSRASQKITHDIRQEVDAVLVGANTVLSDDPQLTSRNNINDRQPIRIMLAGNKFIPENLKIFQSATHETIIAATKNTLQYVSHVKASHVETLLLPENKCQQIHLPSLLDELAKREISSLLVEGGMTVIEHFLEENLVNKIYVYLSPNLIGTFPKKKSIQIQEFNRVGSDFHFVANLKETLHV